MTAIRKENNQLKSLIGISKRQDCSPSINDYKEIPEMPYKGNMPEQLNELIQAYEDNKNWDASYVVTVMLSIVSLLTGNKFKLLVGDWLIQLNIYILLYGDSAAAKTPVFRALFSRLYEIDSAEEIEHEKRLAEYNERKEAANQGTGKSSFTEKPPRKNQYIINSSTIEGLKGEMSGNPRPIYLFSDEAVSFLGSFNKYNKGTDDRGVFMSMYEGERRNDLTKSGGIATIGSVHFVFGGTFQPSKAKDVIGTNYDGASFRYMIAHSEREDKPVNIAIPEDLKNHWTSIIDKLVNIDYNYVDGIISPELLTPTKEALKTYQQFSERLSIIINDERKSYVSDLIKKYRGICWKLAGIMQVLYYVTDEDGSKSISERAVCAAIDFCNYYIAVSIKAHEDVYGRGDTSRGLFGDKLNVYEDLPDEFKRAEGLEICARYNIATRTADDFFKDSRYFIKTKKNGYYAKA